MRRTLALTNKNMTRWCAADIRAKRWGRMSDGQMAQRSSVLEACARQGGSVRIASTSSDVNQVIAVRPAPARRSLSLRRLVVACVPMLPSACPPSRPALDLHRPVRQCGAGRLLGWFAPGVPSHAGTGGRGGAVRAPAVCAPFGVPRAAGAHEAVLEGYTQGARCRSAAVPRSTSAFYRCGLLRCLV